MLIIFFNILVFIWQVSYGLERSFMDYGFIPFRIFSGEGFVTLFTSMFMHGDLVHLVGNMWFLWVFGDNLEDFLGKFKFLFFYIACGLLASFAHMYTTDSLITPAIGASGAISGILGGYVLVYPHNKIKALFAFGFYWRKISVKAYVYIVIWFLYQLLYVGSATNVAYMAHIGGFFGGMVLMFSLKGFTDRQDFLKIRT